MNAGNRSRFGEGGVARSNSQISGSAMRARRMNGEVKLRAPIA